MPLEFIPKGTFEKSIGKDGIQSDRIAEGDTGRTNWKNTM